MIDYIQSSAPNFINHRDDITFYKKEIKPGIIQEREGDLLVGFYSETPVSFDVYIKKPNSNQVPLIVFKHTLGANEFTFAANNSVIPIIKLSYQDITISETVTGIFATLHDVNTRRLFYNNDFFCKTKLCGGLKI